ncbi:adenosylhomocysteine nucleosidase [Neisseria sp. HSC-16F19]|nr:5'-methylthioadenosine/adenosylhomocysteine nucleosidase [Neisseria sp. HSC-16F19]MCP2040709.1 adenosylhomocysteine nucleosidase [Neisseria sp. HSC-16F19]
MTLAIIGAMQPELDLLQSRLENAATTHAGSVVFHHGRLNGREVVLVLSGIGKVNAAMATALVIQQFKPQYVINTGSAGGLAAGIRVGDVVIGTEAAHHDVDVTVFGYAPGQVPQQPARFGADERLAAAAERAAAAFAGAAVHRGLVVSGDQFVNDSGKIAAIRGHFADVQAVEMEAAAIAQTCHQQGVPFVIVRAVSDAADEEAGQSFEAFLQTASVHSAEMVCALVAAL